MKRIISIALIVLLTAAVLAGCGSSDPEGSYVIKSIDGKDVNEEVKSGAEATGMSEADFLNQFGVESADELITLDLNADGTFVMDIKMFGSKLEGTWAQDGDKISVTVPDAADDTRTIVFSLSGNELSNSEGDPKYVFGKK